MEISPKEWFTTLAMIDRLRSRVDAHGTKFLVQLRKLCEMGILSEDQLQVIEEAFNEADDLAESLEFARMVLTNPQNPEKQYLITRTGVLAGPPETLADRMETAFDDVIEQALYKFRGEQEGGDDGTTR